MDGAELIHSEVTGVEQESGGRAYGDGQAGRDGVIDGDEFAFKVAEGDSLSGFYLDEVGLEAMLLDLGLHEGKGELRSVDGDVRPFLEQIRHLSLIHI